MNDDEGSTAGSRHSYGLQAQHPHDFHATAEELELFDPELVLGFYRRLETLLDGCPIDIYAASSLKHPWPHRLQNAKECYPASFWRSPNRILDSAITSPELSNEDVLAHAVERHATAVVVKDYLPFDAYSDDELAHVPDTADNVEATTESIREFAAVYDAEKHPPAYIPLHPPYDDHVRAVAEIVGRSELDQRYMLGGLKDADPSRRIDELLAFREEVGPTPIAHGLGWGLSDALVETLRDEPGLLDSVDNSGPSQAIQNGRVLNKHWQSTPCAHVDGKYQNTVGGAFEFAILLSGVHRLTNYNDDFDETAQTGLVDFGGAIDDD